MRDVSGLMGFGTIFCSAAVCSMTWHGVILLGIFVITLMSKLRPPLPGHLGRTCTCKGVKSPTFFSATISGYTNHLVVKFVTRCDAVVSFLCVPWRYSSIVYIFPPAPVLREKGRGGARLLVARNTNCRTGSHVRCRSREHSDVHKKPIT